jgi:hypothetical protein
MTAHDGGLRRSSTEGDAGRVKAPAPGSGEPVPDPEPFMNRRLHERAGPAAQLWELTDTGHVGGIFAHPEEYQGRMLSLFDAALLGQR